MKLSLLLLACASVEGAAAANGCVCAARTTSGNEGLANYTHHYAFSDTAHSTSPGLYRGKHRAPWPNVSSTLVPPFTAPANLSFNINTNVSISNPYVWITPHHITAIHRSTDTQALPKPTYNIKTITKTVITTLTSINVYLLPGVTPPARLDKDVTDPTVSTLPPKSKTYNVTLPFGFDLNKRLNPKVQALYPNHANKPKMKFADYITTLALVCSFHEYHQMMQIR